MTRKLDAKYTVEQKVDIEITIEEEVLTELAKNIRQQMDQEMLYNLCLMSGWAGATVSYQQLDEIKEWVETNKLSEVRWFDNRVAFQDSKDYEWFILRWG
jgi:oligoribonuclease (3'-5' exoribonuclease)